MIITVIFCVNKSGPHLRASIESVLGQTYRDFEFLIGANNCCDSLIDEIQQICGGDRRVKIVRTSLGQLAFSLNNLIEQARTEWIVRMDSDDVCLPNRFRELVTAMGSGDWDVIGSWAVLINEFDQVVGRFCPATIPSQIWSRFRVSSQLCHPTVAFRRSFWLRMGGYSGGRVSEDYDLWLRALLSGARITNVPSYLLRYRIHGNQVSRTRLGYAEVASYWFREVAVSPRLYTVTGLAVSTIKLILMAFCRSVLDGCRGRQRER